MWITQISKSSSGARLAKSKRLVHCATPASTWISTAKTRSLCSTRTPTTRCASPMSSCMQSRKIATGHTRLLKTVHQCARSRHATCGAKLQPPHGSAQTQACSLTPPLISGTPLMQRAASMAQTHAANTCTSTTQHATWHRSTCSSTSTTPTPSMLTHTVTPLK
ncbi:unannotated protein [freshwater metagenome]|uniref:Unannotated protein n=1 Tax=freshwater metagenome TaxID=449393 RepID=A0A6J7LDL0_9ZZZZ